jgi:anaerobic magnesium-protoporphyrin IX monomethyl ester cyclase
MTRHKVVLYNPQAVFHTMPLALLAVGSGLDPERFEVRIVDGRLEDDPIARVLEEVKDAVCLGETVLTGAPIRDALAVSRAVKAARPKLPVIWGGWHPSLFPTDTLAEPSVDITVQGQGENTFVELVERLANGEDAAAVPGTASRVNGEPIQHLPRALSSMDALPSANYELIPVERYFQLKGDRQLDYIASTGCYFRCAYCADPFVYKRRWVGLAPERVGEEAEALWKRYHFTDLAFQDETFFTFEKRVVAIAEQFLSRNLRFTWTATLRADQADRLGEGVLALCRRSGLRRVMIGVESGSQEMLDWMSKDITVEQVLFAADQCRRQGIGAIFPFIVGFPSESDESVEATLRLVKTLRSMSSSFETPIFYYQPYPGSRIAADVVAAGYQLPSTLEEWANFDFVGAWPPWVSPEKHTLVERFKFYNRFAWGPSTWPRRPLQAIARWRCSRDFYRLPLEKLLVDRLKPLPKLS